MLDGISGVIFFHTAFVEDSDKSLDKPYCGHLLVVVLIIFKKLQ